jgi:histidine ammonia-lyase
MDYACLAAAEIGSISDRRSYYALEGKVAGVPKLLFEKTGLHSGFMILQYTSAALVSENKGLCFPASADSIPTSLGQEDHVSMGSIGGRKALRVCQNLRKILAVELLCAAQAFEYHRPLRSGAVPEAAFALVRERIPFATEDRIFSQDIHRADRLLENGDLLEIMNHFKTSAYSRHDDLFENY